MSPWQVNSQVNQAVTSDLAWSALPQAPTVADRPSRVRALRRALVSALRTMAGRRADRDAGAQAQGTPSPAC